MLLNVAAGEIDVVIGTQAVLEEDVFFRKLGLVVIDEQHKFGVRQRATLRGPTLVVVQASRLCEMQPRRPHPEEVSPEPQNSFRPDPHSPRDDRHAYPADHHHDAFWRPSCPQRPATVPPGRQQVRDLPGPMRPSVRSGGSSSGATRSREGRQGFVIVPLVEESDQIVPREPRFGLRRQLANGPPGRSRLGLIHGRLSAAEKDAVMGDFREGRIPVLVDLRRGSRRGRAQRHPDGHRGGRAIRPGPIAPASRAGQPRLVSRILRRLRRPANGGGPATTGGIVSTTDGFRLAEVDFELRGPGELFGTRQHGLPPMRIADLARDAEILADTRRDADVMITADPDLSQAEHARLRQLVLTRYGQTLNLGDVG